MPQNSHLEIVNADGRLAVASSQARDPREMRDRAQELAQGLRWLPNSPASRTFVERSAAVARTFRPILTALDGPPPKIPVSDDFRWLYDNGRLLATELEDTARALAARGKTPHVRTPPDAVLPRSLALAEAFLEAVGYEFTEQAFTAFVEEFQHTTVLKVKELWTLVAAIKLVLLEQIAARGTRLVRDPGNPSPGVAACVRSLRKVGEAPWRDVLEPLMVIDQILRQDSEDCYSEMDRESRDLYRKKLINIADHSDFSELEVAREAVALAQAARPHPHADPRTQRRESQVGYYLVDRGAAVLHRKVGFHPPLLQKIQGWMRRNPDELYLVGIEILMLVIIAVALLFLTDSSTSPELILFTMALLLLTSSESAVQLMNHLVTAVLPSEILPKLDFSGGVPDDCVTMIAVPSLLLREDQVRGLIEGLEVRFLGNHDPNICFALLTDLPDTREPAREDSPLVTLCSDLIRELNEKYASQGMGSFLLFHRHRVYNPRERVWMGWERKRGKLLDLNKLLRGQHDSFPVKAGDLSILPRVRFVITLDADTELPRGTACRMIGALAHPLNQAVVDPEKKIVVAGYGILQPRVGISVQSTSRSRLAAIYAGETGFDIYTRAVSDAYQDLYGEGSFTGKGIYEVDTVHRVLDRRFPRNALLSHDLIEGAYARSGLVSDIEVIEDYPSHYNAYNRRKHRWLRGDWQVAGWLLPRVPSESGEPVPNPISFVSRWKIFDNLRRSLVEPSTFLLLLAAWLTPGWRPWQWTLATLCILFLPTWFRFAFNLARATVEFDSALAREAISDFHTSNVTIFFTLVFLAHQTMLSLDAVVRALLRRFITRRRLLEWETAAEADLNVRGRTPVEVSLSWVPLLALGVAVLVWAARPQALPAALPVLFLWACSKPVSAWLNRPPQAARKRTSAKDLTFLRRAVLHTWRYFAEFSTAEHNWLIPDNVQEEPPAIAARVSPTNVGFLLNARQVACEFGYLAVPEFAEQTTRTLATLASLKKHRGHMFNWYDTRTLAPMAPFFISSVDSGNLLASLWTLQQGCVARLRQPILQPCLSEGFLDYLRILADARAVPRKLLANCEKQNATDHWLQSMLSVPEAAFDPKASRKSASGVRRLAEEALARVRSIRQIVNEYAPWCSPEFAVLRDESALNLKLMDSIALEQLPEFIDKRISQLEWSIPSLPQDERSLQQRFRDQLLTARDKIEGLITDLRTIAGNAGRLADEIDFSFLLNQHRNLISVGYDAEQDHLHDACYDLLATESRTAVFVAIAKEDIPQESWFLLGRAHTLDEGRPILLSWTGTLFEYLMPSLWMRSYSNTLLERSRAAVVQSQQIYAKRKAVPWGISESAYYKLDDGGNYQYSAFGLPHLALRKRDNTALVISPYSSFLSLNADPAATIGNLRRMADMGWFGSYGFYESADFTSRRRWFWQRPYRLVRCWMVHHQGMTLLALANFLLDDVVQKWFHAERRVQATELLLHEKPVAHVRRRDLPRRQDIA